MRKMKNPNNSVASIISDAQVQRLCSEGNRIQGADVLMQAVPCQKGDFRTEQHIVTQASHYNVRKSTHFCLSSSARMRRSLCHIFFKCF